MTVSLLLAPSENVPGVPVAEAGALPGSLVVAPGDLQFGRLLMGSSTRMKWRSLTGWRNTPGTDVTDAPRPTGPGDFAGSVYPQGAVVTFVLQLRGTPAMKSAALQVLEDHTPLDGVERPLVVDDGSGPSVRMARLVSRDLPEQDKTWTHGPLQVTLQWRCADPLRYALDRRNLPMTLPSAVGGLTYPLDYPLVYGDVATGSATARNTGNAHTPAVVTFTGPLVRPTLSTPGWSLSFDITLAAGESLTADAASGEVDLDGADRLNAISPMSDPVEDALLPPGRTALTFTAASGTGTCTVSWADGSL